MPFSGEEVYPSCCITDALKTVTTDESGLPDLRIPFNGDAETKDVRTACEVGRGRNAEEVSSDEEYPPSLAGPRCGRRWTVCVLEVDWGGGGDIGIGAGGGISGLAMSGSGQGLMRGARGVDAIPQVAWLLLDIV